MDKIRGFLNPGKEKDDETMYGSGSQADSSDPSSGNTGKLTGQGSHLSGIGADSSAPSTTQTVGSTGPTGADTTGTTGRQDNASAASIKSGVLGNDPRTASTTTGDNSSSVNTSGPVSSGAGVAAAKAWQSHEDRQGTDTPEYNMPGAYHTDPNNPYRTSQLDPRVDSGNRASTTQSTSTPHRPTTKTDYGGPRTTGNYGGDAGAPPEHERQDIESTPGRSGQTSHAGRDAGLAAGGAALGAHEYEKHKDRDTSNTSDNYPSSTSNKTHHPATSGDLGTDTGNSGYERSTDQYSNTGTTSQTEPNQSPSIYNRATGGLAAGAAAVGLGSQAEKHDTRDTTDTRTTEEIPAGHDTSARNTSRMATDTTDDQQTNQGSGVTGKAAGALAGGAAAVGLTSHQENKDDKSALERDTQGSSTTRDYHTPETMAGAPSDKTHGRDVSRTVDPTHGSARAPSFLGHLTGEEPSAVTDTSDRSGLQESHHHAARDAERAAGGAGAAGVAEHEARKHYQPDSSGEQTAGGPTQSMATRGQHPGMTESTDQHTPATNTSQENPHPRDDHRARDAALAGGAGAGLAGAAYEVEHHQHEPRQPTQPVEPRAPVQSKEKAHTQATPTYYGAATTERDPSQVQAYNEPQREHHLGRDAAAGTAVGAGALGYEAEHGHHQPHDSATPPRGSQSLGPQSQRSGQPYETGNTTGPGSTVVNTDRGYDGDNHRGRDAALASAGAAGLGGAAYEAHKKEEQRDHPSQTHQDQRYQSEQDHHLGRDATAGTAAGVGTGAAAHELSKKEAEKQQKVHEQELAKQQKAYEKEIAKEHKAEEKAHHKEVVKEQKAHEKEIAKEQKAHEKEIAKEHKAEEKAHEKAVAQEEKQREKEAAAAAAAEEKEKKPSLIDRILHRHKDSDTTDETTEDHHRGEEVAAAGAVGVAGTSAYEYDQQHGRGSLHEDNKSTSTSATQNVEHQKHGRNVLHKDPPTGYQDDANRVQYEEAPTRGYASEVTGGTGTTALAKGNEGPQGSHLSGAGNTLDPAIHDRPTTVTEPITGLPMNLSHGTGMGGTDGGPQSGYQG